MLSTLRELCINLWYTSFQYSIVDAFQMLISQLNDREQCASHREYWPFWPASSLRCYMNVMRYGVLALLVIALTA